MEIAEVVKRLAKDERGTEVIEYAAIIGLIAVGVIATAALIGEDVVGIFQNLLATVQSAANPALP